MNSVTCFSVHNNRPACWIRFGKLQVIRKSNIMLIQSILLPQPKGWDGGIVSVLVPINPMKTPSPGNSKSPSAPPSFHYKKRVGRFQYLHHCVKERELVDMNAIFTIVSKTEKILSLVCIYGNLH